MCVCVCVYVSKYVCSIPKFSKVSLLPKKQFISHMNTSRIITVLFHIIVISKNLSEHALSE